jgi:hypothetical protein
MVREFSVATTMYCLEGVEGITYIFYFIEDAMEYMKQNNIVATIQEIPVLRSVVIG